MEGIEVHLELDVPMGVPHIGSGGTVASQASVAALTSQFGLGERRQGLRGWGRIGRAGCQASAREAQG